MAGQRQFDEKQTLHRALEVFWTKGYGATSMQDIATATGVLRGSLYNAYRDKETLFLCVFEGYRDDFLSEAAEMLAHLDVDRALGDLFDFTITSMTEGIPPRGCLTTKTATDTKAEGPRIETALRGLLDALEKLVRERLSKEDARLRLTVSPAEAARVLVTMTRGNVVMESVYHDAERLRATARSLVRALLPAGAPVAE
ncbi:TetR/AcrR family transcriptional regulator [Streptomyces sp. NPDC102274]|uniref:TetR/AcrR family transcriptional regulator n=1 Tax=Streptomyces sp. NPDC102274 TaxID=3366151 RepID=UPI00380826C0